MTLAVEVLGCAGSWPGPDRACSSYLVDTEGYRLLVDCGNGSLSNLLRGRDANDVDALVVSHRHPDHWADLVGLYYARRFHPDGARRLPVYGPAGLSSFIGQLLPGDDAFTQVCDFVDVAPGDAIRAGPLLVRTFAGRHPVPTLAMRIEGDGAVVAYSADSDVTPTLAEAARDADLFLCEATWPEGAATSEGVHLTGREAGRLAADARARRLVVTHVQPAYDPRVVAAQAAAAFGGETVAAVDGLRIAL